MQALAETWPNAEAEGAKATTLGNRRPGQGHNPAARETQAASQGRDGPGTGCRLVLKTPESRYSSDRRGER